MLLGGTHWLRITFVVLDFPPQHDVEQNNFASQQRRGGGGSGGAGGAVSSMIQATSEAKYFWWWYWAGFLEPPFCWSKELNP